MKKDFDRYILACINSKQEPENTIKARKEDYKAFINVASEKPIKDYTIDDIDDFICSMSADKLSPQTINRRISTLKYFFNWAIGRGLAITNPTTGAMLPKRKEPEYTTITAEQREQLIKTAKTDTDVLAVGLMGYLGLRISEAINVKPSDILDDWINVIGKGGKLRCLPLALLPKQAQNALKNLISKNVDDTPILKGQRGVLTTNGLYRRIEKLYVACGISSGATPHTLRHTTAVQAIQSDVDLQSLRQILGHSSLTTTSVYLQKIDKKSLLNNMKDICYN